MEGYKGGGREKRHGEGRKKGRKSNGMERGKEEEEEREGRKNGRMKRIVRAKREGERSNSCFIIHQYPWKWSV